MRAVLADGEPTVRNALRALLTQGLGVQVVGEADSLTSLQHQVRLGRPDLVIVAWDLVATQAEELLAVLRDSSPGLRILVLGLRPEMRRRALAAGADAFMSKVDAPDVVVRVLETWQMDVVRERDEQASDAGVTAR